MAEDKTCDACGMTYHHPGVWVQGKEYCCTECAMGEPCTCSATRGEELRPGRAGYAVGEAIDSPDDVPEGEPLGIG